MKTIKLGLTNKVVFYDSIKDIPADRHHEFNKLLMQDLGIGSEMEDVVKHFGKLEKFLINDKKDSAIQEMKNLHNTFWYIIEGLNIKSFCFMSLVHSVNGKLIEDFSKESVLENIHILSKMGLKSEDVTEIIDSIKKKLMSNFNPTFLIDSVPIVPQTYLTN